MTEYRGKLIHFRWREGTMGNLYKFPDGKRVDTTDELGNSSGTRPFWLRVLPFYSRLSRCFQPNGSPIEGSSPKERPVNGGYTDDAA